MKRKILAITALFILYPSVAFCAVPIDQLGDYVVQRVSVIDHALNAAQHKNHSDAVGMNDATMQDEFNPFTSDQPLSSMAWTFRNFYLRLRLAVGFKIPQFITLTLRPSLEMVWHKLDSHHI